MIEVDGHDGAWFVYADDQAILGPFERNADAWREADRHVAAISAAIYPSKTRRHDAQSVAQHFDKEPVKMSNELMLPPSGGGLPTFANDGWDRAAQESGSRIIKGDILKFKDGKWFAGKSPIPLSPDLRLAAGATTHAWVSWHDGEPTYVPPDARGVLPDRRTLGDTDEEAWPISKFTGKREDPWQRLKVIYLLNPVTAGVMTHASATVGTRIAVNDLADKVAMMRNSRPGAVPLVRLSATPMPTQFGTRDRPHFEVVEWRGGTEANAPEILPPSAKEDLSDEIPF